MLLTSVGFWLTNLPQDVGLDVPEGKLKSLSFAPFREGQGPVQGIFPTVEQIDADLKLMGQKTHNIRTYASAEGNMPAIPELAKKHNVTLLQGAWLNALKDKNKIEIAELIRSANAHPDVVKRVIVGNEVLLRGDLPADQLIEYIREVKRSVKQPVSYADVWSMYMKYPELIKEVDFITIHILPYWEDRPITVEEAPDHIQRIVHNVRQQADAISPNKPILIGEAGWPSAGRQRGWSIPSVVNEAQFIRSLIKVATDNGFDYNIVEAFNQPWKGTFEGIVGANWGLYSIDRQQVFPLTGTVYENPQWHKELIASLIIFFMVTLRHWQALQRLPYTRLPIFLGLLQILSVLLVNQMHTLWHTGLMLTPAGDILNQTWYARYSNNQQVQTVVTVGLNMLLGGLLMRRSYALLANQDSSPRLGSFLYTLYGVISVFVLYQSYQLTMEGRYLSFPTVITYVPVVGLVGLMLIKSVTETRWNWQAMSINQLLGDSNPKTVQNKLMGSGLLLIGLVLIVGETHAFMMSRDLIVEQPEFWIRLRVCLAFTLTNCQLLAWLVSLIVLAIPLLIGDKKAA